ncbi:sulfatase-like hydrolase/transferase [Novosphingobium mangrovi (ex Huang et al. 2023)]|uniref:Sulfatase-like hydrolase/transferase n=1 Tax=Novosphingobium mangrovi (ex Huang et al. 2023) TaxID=2976432 RepID=A0ABT2I819_9SPHN|nr:sulfatase-like hydrolase/transferase [Novosphingobium mangrovi (ex Huang et al. 2023)]MCT2400964.1 sulfatase-like hydrolase/transferase [Novosphingobium mangrovi (ex Huang et al. 2023)]
MDIPFRWLAFWLLLPNLTVMLMWGILGIPMQASWMLSGMLALTISHLPWRAARAIGAAGIVVFVTVLYVCQLFSIPPLNFSLIRQFLLDVRPLQSPVYALAGVVVLANILAAMYFAPRVPRFTGKSQFLYAAVAIGLFINLDGAFAFDARKSHRTLPDDEIPVHSAAWQVGLSPDIKHPHNVLLIVVESLGAPAMPEGKALFAADWDRPEWRERYDVSHGKTEYFGSTTNGTLRELCTIWAHYSSFDFAKADCLPGRFRDAGYETTAMHSFTSEMFERNTWYPKIGFEHMIFADELLRAGARSCPGVFPGACDADIPPMIVQKLARAKKPQFVYWLTLNTHLPIVENGALGTDHCSIGTAQWRSDYPMLCRLFQLHHVLADKISRLAMSPDLPPTDILIVGDHKPPLFDRTLNGRFDQGHVPWIYLKARTDAQS